MAVTDDDILSWGSTTVPMAGETECGDRCLVRPSARGRLVAAVDGLGHGTEAARAADLAIDVLQEAKGDETLSALMQRCHERLEGTRGVVMSLVDIDAGDRQMTWLGVGNVEGRLARFQAYGHQPSQELLLRPGIVGVELPKLREATETIARRDLVVLASDGVDPEFYDAIDHGSEPADIAGKIMREHYHGKDDAIVVVARFTG